MNEKVNSNNSTYFAFWYVFVRTYRRAIFTGFGGVLLYWSDEFGNVEYKHNVELARNNGLFVENIHTSFDIINDLWLDNLNGSGIAEYLLRCVDDCYEYEIPTMIVHITSGEDPPIANMLGINRIRQVTEKAEQRGVNVALENLRNIENLECVFEYINSGRLGFCFDSGHQNYRSKNIDLFLMYGDK